MPTDPISRYTVSALNWVFFLKTLNYWRVRLKIAFFIDNSSLPKTDFSRPFEGSPGVGASLYIQVAVPFFLDRYSPDFANLLLLAPHTAYLPETIQNIRADNITDAASVASEWGADFFVFRVRQFNDEGILEHIDRLGLPAIGVGQLTPSPKILRRMSNTKFFKSLVCVGREQFDSLIDTPMRNKISYIDNGVHYESCIGSHHNQGGKDPNLVVFMGALTPAKGFHVLAEAWPLVLKQHPEAKLSVIGSVRIYGENEKVGPLGVSSIEYETNHILPFLSDGRGRLHSSVTFHGKLLNEKFDIIRRATVGVVNPTGQTETCCVSAIEMSACKTAVVSGAYYALLDTVLHQKTGLLGRGTQTLAENIVRCLKNKDLAYDLGVNGSERVQAQFDFLPVTQKWMQLFLQLKKAKQLRPEGRLKNLRYHLKFLRVLNSIPQQTLGRVVFWPSTEEAVGQVRKLIRMVK